MNRRLLWKLCLIIATGTVALFYAISILNSRAEDGMSFLADEDRHQLTQWGREAEQLYLKGDEAALKTWLDRLKAEEDTWAAMIQSAVVGVAGSELNDRFYEGYWFGRSVDWKIHLHFEYNPIMEVTFKHDRHLHFLIVLPERMRPGLYRGYASAALQVLLPMILLTLLSIVLYRHIMSPLRQLEQATRHFSEGRFNVRVREKLGNRSDEMSELANTFDQMAARIGELIISQRQLIADLSHELRTPLTRLDMAIERLQPDGDNADNIARISRESQHIRRLVVDTLTLAWLENERPTLKQESLDLVDLLDVLAEDARFEFPDRQLLMQLPDQAPIDNSNHRALGQALENIVRNALRYTPAGDTVTVALSASDTHYTISISDRGPGVPEQSLDTIFQPFYRVDASRHADTSGFGLGLALARRQVEAIGGSLVATNLTRGGLQMTVTLPHQ
ncbi:histidine kinase sensor domain-containing protein [Spongiibacter taiwanensis]|uniref:histidine kinase sensor domain-containing protein n=1 Tax=Spongiibacter taiwanensis TaxID=1748242 RepID=UPI0020365E54|nr:histidine kinase sensor domain-containing protein [Spongiibacter taiwanensis]USA42671.1 histidine kinase sensor domain-containing protein [Spongiibacter taiwanensis]